MEARRPADRTGTRERFIEAMTDLLQRQGYAATGLAEVTARSGAPRGSLYFHFPEGKEQLAAAALQLGGERFTDMIDAAIAAAPDAASAIRILVAALSNRLQSSQYELGCPIATTALEQAASWARLRETVHAVFLRWIETFRVRLQAEGCDPAMAEEQALFAVSAIEGALVLA